jgi:hypothetical protein
MPCGRGWGQMTFVELVEVSRSCETKRRTYLIVILCALALIFAVSAAEFSGFSLSGKARELVDFDDFYIAGQLAWRGEIDKAYRFATMSELQKAISGTEFFLPWTYPPQFDLLVAPLALLPPGLAYALFVSATLGAYLLILRRIGGTNFVSALIVMCPAILITIKCGQNGFLTGTLIGLTCLGFQANSAWAGLPLGLMIVKPHLAIGFALYTLVTRRWRAAAVAAAIVLATSAIATVLLGASVWTAVLDGAKEARIFLEQGFYPLHRMISIYAVLRSLQAPAFVAMAAQICVALGALGAIAFASRRLNARQSLGVTAIASLLISPYAYDYDLPILGIGLALLLPDLVSFGSERERLSLYCLTLFVGAFGIAQAEQIPDASANSVGTTPHSLGGLALVAMLVMSWRILLRNDESRVEDVCAIGSSTV